MNTLLRVSLLVGLAAAASMSCATAAALSAQEQRMVEWIDAHSEDAIALLEETVNISSGTMNHEGVRKVGDCDAPRTRCAGS